MNIGFTGWRKGMSLSQQRQLGQMLEWLGAGDHSVYRFHYGTHASVVLWADLEAAEIARERGWEPIPHHALSGGEIARNEEIAKASDVLIAAPETDHEQLRSGTWTTVRRMRKLGRPVVMLSRGDEQ